MFPSRCIRLAPLRICRSNWARVSGQKFARSFRLVAAQAYSTGFNSGAYAGNRFTVSHENCVLRKVLVLFDLCAGNPSQISISFPRTWRRSILTVRMTVSERTVFLRIRRYNLGFLPYGVETIMPTTERIFQLPVERITGVLPRGAQVFRIDGRSEMPDSSQKQIFALTFSPFFGYAAT